jgi:uncharacterized protein with NRDE domain
MLYNPDVCTLAIYFQCSPEFPVVVAANRDEYFDRPATAPAVIADEPWVVAGTDLFAGGTWLGVNGEHVVAGVLNRRTGQPPDPTRRSRGLLCLDVLRHANVAAATAAVCRERGDRYNPFNLLIASPDAACVVGNITGSMVVTSLQPGVHLLTNLELNDAECPRIAKSYQLFEAARRLLQPGSLAEYRHVLSEILADHSTPLDPRSQAPPNNLCVHTERFGTRSSTQLIYARDARAFRMWHADGAPCRTAYVEIALPTPELR